MSTLTMMEMDARRAGVAIGESVTDVELTIAKHIVMGVSEGEIAEIFDATPAEVAEILATPKMEELRQLLALEYARSQVEVDLSYEALEEAALGNLIKEAKRNRDPDFNLKAAALANRATRRVSNHRRNVLDPRQTAGQRVMLTLTKRVIEQFTQAESAVGTADKRIPAPDTPVSHRAAELEFRITESSAKPSFEDIDDLLGVLGVQQRGVLASTQESPTRNGATDADWDEFVAQSNRETFGHD